MKFQHLLCQIMEKCCDVQQAKNNTNLYPVCPLPKTWGKIQWNKMNRAFNEYLGQIVELRDGFITLIRTVCQNNVLSSAWKIWYIILCLMLQKVCITTRNTLKTMVREHQQIQRSQSHAKMIYGDFGLTLLVLFT